MEKAVLCISTSPPDHARRIARLLVEEGHAACVNIIPGADSIYRWKGKIEEDHESVLLLKTAASHGAALESRLLELHPHDCPEFIVLDIADGAKGYLEWVMKNTGPGEDSRE